MIKFIIIILICFSVISWAIIIQCSRILFLTKRETKIFESKFWSSIELSNLYQEILTSCNSLSSLEQIFCAGFKEFIHLYNTNSNTPKAIIEGVSRIMHISINRELETLRNYIQFLDIFFLVSIYIGLFGTILSIIHVFIKLGTVKQVNLQMIAPEIAESLITTAIGLFIAIPAIIAFNYLNLHVNRLKHNYQNFTEEFIIILHRQVFTINNNINKNN